MMKKAFVGYYKLSEEEFTELWANSRIVVDANVLLAVYGVSPSTREALLTLLDKVRDRLWIPHQFALEYQRNRLAKILEQVKHYADTHKNLTTTLNDQFRSKTRHPFVEEQVETGLEEICKRLANGKLEQEKLLTHDPYFDRTTELFDGRVGASYTEAELAQAYEVARKRFSEKIPPGFKDSDKPEPDCFGDYIGWRQILDFAKKNNVPVILVTDDAKEDWWRREGAETFGPHPKLVVEFRTCCTQLFYMYSSDRFLEFSARYLGGPVDAKAISELKERRESEPSTSAKKPLSPAISDPHDPKPTAVAPDAGSMEDISGPKTAMPAGEDVKKPEEG